MTFSKDVMSFFIPIAIELSTRSPRIWLIVELSISIPDFMIIIDIIAPSQASRLTPEKIKIIAAKIILSK